jgi:hypothetical protein
MDQIAKTILEWQRIWNNRPLRRIRSPRLALRTLDGLALPFFECGGFSGTQIERLKNHFRDKLAAAEAVNGPR